MKEFFVTAIPLAVLDDDYNIPTVLFYSKDGNVFIGNEAINKASQFDIQYLNQDFKVDLGNIKQNEAYLHKKYETATGRKISAFGLTKDFLNTLLKRADPWFKEYTIDNSNKNILVAEPISLQGDNVNETWLTNYRKHLKELLGLYNFENIDFLPEPFAVFQYYRYGVRLPLVTNNSKQCVLVIDFGGGTFDTSVIETTLDGDIKIKGKNSKPLGASSIPVGGFAINKELLIELLLSINHKVNHVKIKKGIDLYNKWRKDDLKIPEINIEYQYFIQNFHKLIYQIEITKLSLSKLINNWKLEFVSDVKVPVSIPSNMFVLNNDKITHYVTAQFFKNIYIEKIWKQKLKGSIKSTLQRAKKELEGQPISLVLLSGGSANIGWLKELIISEFPEELGDISILKIDNFQEVVSKGLAIECMRRMHNDDGDFAGTTYNTLNLLFGGENISLIPRRFKPIDKNLPQFDIPGVLLKSATSLYHLIETPITWKFSLEKLPKHHLNYYFLRSSFDPEDIDALQNVMENKIDTPKDISFDSNLKIQLTVKEDGTAYPRIIYKTGINGEPLYFKDGKSFVLDMTFAAPPTSQNSYLGLDFGTTNTSISFIDKEAVQIYETRSKNKDWSEISDLANTLPYPLAYPLSHYLANIEKSALLKAARKFFESSLALISYSLYNDYCSTIIKPTYKLFKNYTQMSAGPLWQFIKNCLDKSKESEFSKSCKILMDSEHFEVLDPFITLIAKVKHDKEDESKIDTLRPVKVLANLSNFIFKNYDFGYFENIKKTRFTNDYNGIFRVTHGVPPFTKYYNYSGPNEFEEYEPYLFNKSTKKAISLSPLIIWNQCINQIHHSEDYLHCYLFDINDKGIFSYKAIGENICTFKLNQYHFFAPLLHILVKMIDYDQPKKWVIVENLDKEETWAKTSIFD